MPPVLRERLAVERTGVPLVRSTNLEAIVPGVRAGELQQVLDVTGLRTIDVRCTRIQIQEVALQVSITVGSL